MATDHEVQPWPHQHLDPLRAKPAPEHIRETWIGTSWIAEVAATGSRAGKAFQAKHMFVTSLRTTPDVLLQLVRDRWIIEG